MEKKRSIINLFDIIVIILAAAVAVLLFVARGAKDNETTLTVAPSIELRYTLELNDVLEETAGDIKVGDTLYDNENSAVLGTITAVEDKERTRRTTVEETGEIKLAPVPGYKTVIVSLTGSAVDGEREMKVDGLTNIRVGRGIAVRGPGYYAAGNVIEIERGE